MSVIEKRKHDLQDLLAHYRKYSPNVKRVQTGLSGEELSKIAVRLNTQERLWWLDGFELKPRNHVA